VLEDLAELKFLLKPTNYNYINQQINAICGTSTDILEISAIYQLDRIILPVFAIYRYYCKINNDIEQ